MGSIDIFGHVELFVDLTLLTNFCSSQFISTYYNIQDNNNQLQNFLKITYSWAVTQQLVV